MNRYLVGILSKQVTIKKMDHFWLVKNNCNRAIVCESNLFPHFPLSASKPIRMKKKKQDIYIFTWFSSECLWLCYAIFPLNCSNQSVSRRGTCWWFTWHVSIHSILQHQRNNKTEEKLWYAKLLKLIWFKPDRTLRFYKEGSDSLCAQLHHWACKGLYKQEEFSLNRLYCILIQVWTGHHCYGPFHSLVQRW